jgi:Tfp pilus assembly protein PilO
MQNSMANTLVLVVLALIVAGAGYYVTEVRQPAEMQMIEDQAKEMRLRYARAEALLSQSTESEGQADQVVKRWKARYKIIPQTIETPDIVDYLERLTSRGFEDFSISLKGASRKQNVSHYTFSLRGTGFFKNVYELIWHLENNREFYHIHDISLTATTDTDKNTQTGLKRRQDVVDFSMNLDAFFAGSEGVSAPDSPLLPVPVAMLPKPAPWHNSFYPVVRTDLPPNDRQLIDVEQALLVSVIGNKAVFQDELGLREVVEGDEVYLGRIVMIDPSRAKVRASLNKGGITDVIDLAIGDETEKWREAEGRRRLAPIEND